MKKFFQKIWSFLNLLIGNVDVWVKENVTPSIEFVEKLKSLLDNPVADILTAIIPGSWDDALKAKIIANLQKVLSILQVTADITSETDPAQQLLKLIEFLKTLSPALRNAYYFKIASELAKQFNGGKEDVAGHSVDLLTQLQVSKHIEADKAAIATQTVEEVDADNNENNVTTAATETTDNSEEKVVATAPVEAEAPAPVEAEDMSLESQMKYHR